MFGIIKLICYTKQNNCKNSAKKNLIHSFYWLKFLCVLIGISLCQYLNAMPIPSLDNDYTSSSSSPLSVGLPFLEPPFTLNENDIIKTQPNANEQQHIQKTAIKIDENTILFENLGNNNFNNNLTPDRLKNKPKRKQRKNQGQNSPNAKTSDSNSKNAYFSFSADMAPRLQRQNEFGKNDDFLGYSPNSRKIFKADKTLQRLEKKSWKIPIKSIVLYSENSNSNAKVASKFGQLSDAFDLIKDS